MRTVSGRTDHVVVVGAGLGGLSTALRLAGAGRSVTVLERETVPGGRSGLLEDGGYAFDLEVVPALDPQKNGPIGVPLTIHPGILKSIGSGWTGGLRPKRVEQL